MRRIHPEGLAVYERAAQDGVEHPVVVLVHGTVDRAASFIRVQKRLAEARVVRYDRRGYARSRGLDPTGGLASHVDDLLAVVGEGPAVVVGHSFGGLVSLAAAAHPQSNGAIVAAGAFESPMPWAEWWPFQDSYPDHVDRAALAEGFMRSIVGDDVWERLPERTRADRRAEGDAVFAEVRSVRRGEVPIDFGAVRVPVLVGYGTASPEHLQRAAQETAALLPDARLHVIEGAEHDAHVADPNAFAAFVEQARAPRGPG